jgi:hypothetical protein
VPGDAENIPGAALRRYPEMRVEFTCDCCGVVFERYVNTPRFCSRSCKDSGRGGIPQADGTVLIPLTRGQFAIIDAEDADRLVQYKWSVSTVGYALRFRRKSDVPGSTTVWLHREILPDVPDELEVDHINGNKLDCRRANLRPATRSENNMNKTVAHPSKSGYRGVAWHNPSRSWFARVTKQRKPVFAEFFPTAEEAARAYDKAARIHFGDFARLNFPDD